MTTYRRQHLQRRRSALLFCVAIAAVACAPPVHTTPPSADAPAEEVALSGAAVMIGAGDIASCTSLGDEATAAIVDSVLKADSIAKVDDVVMGIGDLVYESGTKREFAVCWGNSWGDSTKRIMRDIRPVPGNHEYVSAGAAPYFDYFGARAGDPKKGYYAYDLGEWRVLVLNSEIPLNSRFKMADRKSQEEWMVADFKDHPKKCTIAYLHRPLFSSGFHGSQPGLHPLFSVMFEGGVDLVLAGHDHNYERFAPMNPAGMADTVRGMTQIVVGTGGGELRGFRTPHVRNSAYTIQGHFGVVKLTLGAGAWRSAFIDVGGRVWDRSGGTCH
jgi:3',5'-cyclic AMP phosphodiesterase CpdA